MLHRQSSWLLGELPRDQPPRLKVIAVFCAIYLGTSCKGQARGILGPSCCGHLCLAPGLCLLLPEGSSAC